MLSKERICTGFFILFLLCFTPALASAQESVFSRGRAYGGVGYGYHDIDMATDFTRDISGRVIERSSFNNNYNSNSGSLFLGYTLPWDQWYLSGQLGLTLFDDEFELLAGSSKFTNALNHAFTLDVMPGFYLMEKLSLFAKFGLAYGDFDFIKSSPTSTTYNTSDRLLGGTLGAGVAYDVTPRVRVKLGVEQTWYEDIQINAVLGPMTDTTRVEPEVKTVFFTLQYFFK